MAEGKYTGTQPKSPFTLGKETIQLLTDRLRDEYTAHYFYRNASNWCRGVGYKNAEAFFAKEAENELGHAKLLQDYMVDWNVQPTLPEIKPAIEFESLIDIVNKAYALEYGLYTSYNKDSVKLFQSDSTTFDFLQQLRTGQNEAVIEYSDLLNAAELIDPNNLLDILHYEEIYFK